MRIRLVVVGTYFIDSQKGPCCHRTEQHAVGPAQATRPGPASHGSFSGTQVVTAPVTAATPQQVVVSTC